MAMVVKNNLSANNTLEKVDKNSKALAKSLKKVSSGMRINGAEDDASGYSITEKMRVQIRALEQADSNAQTGSSMLKTAEGAVSSTVEILKTLKEKVINAANDTNTDEDRKIIQKELDEMLDQVDDNAMVTYNGKYLVDGSKNGIVVGDNGDGTHTSLVNRSLYKDTTFITKFTDLKDTTGNSLQIMPTDKLVMSYVKGGETYTVTIDPVEDNTFNSLLSASHPTNRGTNASEDLAFYPEPSGGTPLNPIYDHTKIGVDPSGKQLYTPDGEPAITLRAKTPGVEGQIAGLTFCFYDREGNIRKSANASVDNFSEAVRAQNPCGDKAMVFQVGTEANQAVKVGLTDMRSVALGLKTEDGNTLNITTQISANAAINVLDNCIQRALDQQTTIGSILSRLEYTSANLVTADENTQASESTMRDADMAKEMMEYTKSNVLLQASQSMLAQANQNSSAVLSLLQ